MPVSDANRGHSPEGVPLHSRFFPELESIRGVAALAVLGEHSFLRFQGPDLVRFLDGDGHWFHRAGWTFDFVAATMFPGAAAVSLFFVLSGFVLGEALNSQVGQGYFEFMIRRLFRIMPALWASVLAAALIWTVLVRSISLEEIGAHFMLVERWMNSPLWSLQVELTVSALFPLLWWASNKLSILGKVAVLIALIGLSKHDFGLPGIGFAYAFWLGLMVPSVGRLMVRALDAKRAFTLVFVALAGICFARSLALVAGMHIDRLTAAFPSFYLISYFAYGHYGAAGAFLRSRPLRHLGRISYSIYLFHYPVLDLISLGLVALCGASYWQSHPVTGQMICLAGALPLVLITATLAYRFIEAPGIAIGKLSALRWVKAMQRPRDVPTFEP